MDKKETCKDLQELTGQESGIVVYPNNDVIICNWTQVSGLPRLFASGLVGVGEDLELVVPEQIDDILDCLPEYCDVIYDLNNDFSSLKGAGGKFYDLGEVKVIAPYDWA